MRPPGGADGPGGRCAGGAPYGGGTGGLAYGGAIGGGRRPRRRPLGVRRADRAAASGRRPPPRQGEDGTSDDAGDEHGDGADAHRRDAARRIAPDADHHLGVVRARRVST